MVAMDPDTEFNALATLYQSVVTDMKSSYPAWETVGQRAVKLAASLRTTVTALAAFNDSVQHVSDLASNLKGASRDVGACVTRVCMRQRALEGRLKALSDALGDELAVGVHARTAFWKTRTAEMDKNAGKHLKKTRSRKARPDETAVATQRGLCKQLLAEQRAQFAFFLSQMQPVLTAEVALLDEASHIRPSVEALEATMAHVDGEQLVETILADLTQGADSAWKQCIDASFSLCSSTTTTSSEGDPDGGGSSSRMTSPSVMGGYEDPYAPSSVDVDLTPQQHHHPTHGQPIQHIYASTTLPHHQTTSSFVSSNSSLNQHHHQHHHHHQHPHQQHLHHPGGGAISATPSIPRPLLPPTVPLNGMHGGGQRHTLGRRLSSTSVPVPPTPTSLSASPTEISAVSSFRGSASELRPTRPQSFAGLQPMGGGAAAAAGSYAASPLLTPATTILGGGGYGASSSFSCGGSSSSSSSASANHQATSSMIAETVQAIEGLGNDLDQFCTPRAEATTLKRGEYGTSDVYMRNNNNNNNGGGAVRVRPAAESVSARPPPPSRRSSAITAASANAPSVAEARLSMVSGQSGASSLRQSRQSLISEGGNVVEAPPTQLGPAPYNLIDTTPVSFRPQSQYATAGYGRQF